MAAQCRVHPGVLLDKVRKGWYCEVCDRMLSVDELAEAGDGRLPEADAPNLGAGDLDHLPFPVAYPLAFAQDVKRPPSERVDNALFAAYQAMRVTGLVLLADYFACDTSSGHLASAIRGLRMPHWGEWTTLCDKLVKFWCGHFPKEEPERPSHFGTLVEGWRAVNRVKGAGTSTWAEILAGLPGMGGPPTARTMLSTKRGTTGRTGRQRGRTTRASTRHCWSDCCLWWNWRWHGFSPTVAWNSSASSTVRGYGRSASSGLTATFGLRRSRWAPRGRVCSSGPTSRPCAARPGFRSIR
jgi:hypothetical protein